MPGGTDGEPFSDDPDGRVLRGVKLRVQSSLQSIKSMYTDGSWGNRHGGGKSLQGTLSWFDLDEDEDIITVLFWADTTVDGIQFRTSNGRTSPKYGLGKGAPSVLRQLKDGKAQIVAGFDGQAGAKINRLNVIWSERVKTRHIGTTKHRARGSIPTEGPYGRFDDMSSLGNPLTAEISRIVVYHGDSVNSIKVYYTPDNEGGIAHGGTDGRKDEVILETGEFIRKIEGCRGIEISQLSFVTNNNRRWGPYGTDMGTPFVWDASEGAPPHLVPYMGLLCFNGIANKHLIQLGATFAEYMPTKNILKSVKYESNRTPAAAPLSKFALHLTTPIIKILVGPARVILHAYEGTLCQLPFFRAALQGKFREASEKTISMPEDTVRNVSVLMEFLYTGNYTYMYDAEDVRFQEGSKDPTGNLTEGLFHVGVCAIAGKYGCQELVDIAWKSFNAVLKELGDIDTLRLWKAAYAEGLSLPSRKTGNNWYHSDEELVMWTSILFKSYPKEMEETMLEYPVLACDLLRLSSTGYS